MAKHCPNWNEDALYDRPGPGGVRGPVVPYPGPAASCARWRYWDNSLLHEEQEGSMAEHAKSMVSATEMASRDQAAACFTLTRGP